MSIVSISAKQTIEVINRHGDAMGTKDPDIIVRDYAEDAIVLTNLSDKPAKGHEEIKALIEECFQIEILFNDESPTDIIHQEADGEYGLHVFKKGEDEVFGSETYVVRNNKIVFESAYIEYKGQK
ncbi:nuclear transport factor 2 family protein [Oceanobacillus sp. J11TS1]|uniref:nuclear transport factor 2 family protein n=1 Tax=Oceanobacillus sp. J11TS1 TaxID=2807191 RepID=UPI001B0421A7|nr:nuclear transport factor 2 family protein [Oceanobacillus sp. J11TS1]GIO23756.1 hypothetical protein J11TS1_23370 [Oceanobacillus sp. J11TS1]